MLKMCQNTFGGRASPGPARELEHSLDSLAAKQGATSKGRGREGRKGNTMGGEGEEGKGRKGKEGGEGKRRGRVRERRGEGTRGRARAP